MHSRKWIILLATTQIATLVVLVLLLAHYRVVRKIWQRVVHEGRAPGLVSSFENNREYQVQREIFRLYPAGKVDGVVIGDSLAAGVCWQELMPEMKVVGRGIPGDVARGVHHRLGDLRDMDARWLAILVGTNDVFDDRDASAVTQDIAQCLDRLRGQHPRTLVLVIPVPPVANWVEQADERNRVIDEINRRVAAECARREGCRVLVWPDHLRTASGHLSREMTSDGTHLSARAYESLAAMIREADGTGGGGR
jgi:lysophospholipase L1-like esterase